MKDIKKKRLFEVFEKVNKINLKEWYDDEYYQKPKQSKGIGGFGNIDWQILHEQLMVNTELLNAGKTSEDNLMAANVGDFTDYDGMLSHDELKHLEAFDLISINGAFPVIDNEQYKDYNTFKAKALEIWNQEAPTSSSSNDSEAPFLRGSEPMSEGSSMFPIGARVRVSDGSGLDSNKEGIVVSPREVRTDGSGVPTNVRGAYHPVDWKKEVAVRLDDGSLITMFKNRLNRVD